jgi:hypothetical protein
MIQPTEAQIKQFGRMSAAERRVRLTELDAELSSAYVSLRMARAHGASAEYRERRVNVLRDEIERIKQVAARKVAMYEKDIKNILDETEALPAIMENTQARIKRLEEERKFLKAGKVIKKLYQFMEKLEET